jgi:hypothetical protein
MIKLESILIIPEFDKFRFRPKKGNKKRVSYFYRTATTLYPCCVPTLGEFKRSWS